MQEVREEVPDAWHIIVVDLDCHAPKQKVTLYLDAPVAKAFKAMGQGDIRRGSIGSWRPI